MCGLAGFVDRNGQLNNREHILQLMIDAVSHRGPDSQGIWLNGGVGLGHKRLSILDLSPEGAQPMVSQRGNLVIAYNGEVYNFNVLRSDLLKLGLEFRGHSDTEVILAAIDVWGLEAALSRFIGMFAFSLFDRSMNRLYLVRDRIGIKPLYYGFIKGSFVFASELKALRAFAGASLPIDRDAIALFLRHNYIPAPHSIYQGIQKLLPGHILSLEVGQGEDFRQQVKKYWSIKSAAESGINEPFAGSYGEAAEHLDFLLTDAVRLRMMADVPLGAFLSGGIDSTLVTALMQAQSKQPVKTFSVGFYEDCYNEALNAKKIAQFLGTDHTELYVSSDHAVSVIPQLATLFDEPFSDPSQIPTFLVSQLARKNVTVTLSGDGGDELFYGYPRYFQANKIWSKINWLSPDLRLKLSNLISSSSLKKIYKVELISEILSLNTSGKFYERIISHWKDPGAVVLGATEQSNIFSDPLLLPIFHNLSQRMMYFDQVSYLPDDILVKVDRASMGVSLEARVPLLDHRIVEFAWSLPLKFKKKGDKGKLILRRILNNYVPQHLVDRPKHGFSVPIESWLKLPLRDWAENLLDERRLREEGYVNPVPIRAKWDEYLAGKGKWHYYLWDVLMFQSWLEQYG